MFNSLFIVTAWYTTIPNLYFYTSLTCALSNRVLTRPLIHLTSHSRDGSHLGQGPNTEVEVSKGKSKKRGIIRAITPKIEDEGEEGIEESIYKSESDCIIIANSRSNLR
jgi:hypothetical protein